MSLWSTGPKEMGDNFSLGIQLYFDITRSLAFLFLVMSLITWNAISFSMSGTRLDKYGLLREDELSLYLLAKGTIANADFDIGDMRNDEGTMVGIGIFDAIAAWVFLLLSLIRYNQVKMASMFHESTHVNVSQYTVMLDGLPSALPEHDEYYSNLEYFFEVKMRERIMDEALKGLSKKSEAGKKERERLQLKDDEPLIAEIAIIRDFDSALDDYAKNARREQRKQQMAIYKADQGSRFRQLWESITGRVQDLTERMEGKAAAVKEIKATKKKKLMVNQRKVICVFLIFKQAQYRDAAIRAFKYSNSKLFSVFQSSQMYFKKTQIKVLEAEAPDSILWANMDLAPDVRTKRKTCCLDNTDCSPVAYGSTSASEQRGWKSSKHRHLFLQTDVGSQV